MRTPPEEITLPLELVRRVEVALEVMCAELWGQRACQPQALTDLKAAISLRTTGPRDPA